MEGAHVTATAGPVNVDYVDIRLIKPSRVTAKKDLEHIARLMDEGKVKGFVGQRFSLHEAAQAHESSQRGHGRGRIVIHIAD